MREEGFKSLPPAVRKEGVMGEYLENPLRATDEELMHHEQRAGERMGKTLIQSTRRRIAKRFCRCFLSATVKEIEKFLKKEND